MCYCCCTESTHFEFEYRTPRVYVYVLAQLRRAVRLLGGVSCLEGRDGFEFFVDPGQDRVRAHVNLEASLVSQTSMKGGVVKLSVSGA